MQYYNVVPSLQSQLLTGQTTIVVRVIAAVILVAAEVVILVVFVPVAILEMLVCVGVSLR